MKIKLSLFFLLAMVIVSESCSPTINHDSDVSNDTQWAVNPNGDSELALLMREMFDHGMQMKKAIKAGEAIKIERSFDEILTAKATQPEKAASPGFKAFAQSYISIHSTRHLRDLHFDIRSVLV